MTTARDALPRLVRADTPASGSGGWLGQRSTERLPTDLLDGAVNRLGWLSLFYAGSFIIARFIELWAVGLSPWGPSRSALVDVAALGGTLTGTAYCLLAWSRRFPSNLILDFGLIFEVLGAFWIGLLEHGLPESAAEPLRGVSGISLWIAFFVLAVPTTFGKNLLATFGTALMGPVAFLVAIIYHPLMVPPLKLWVQMFTYNFLFAVFAVVLSRFVYKLGLDVYRVREMGSYRLLDLIGAGGMGEVWRAEHRLLARPSALKVIKSDVCSRSDSQSGTLHRRFEREVQATAALRSPHTVAVYDYGSTPDGCFYYVMELLDGYDLEALILRFGPQPPERVIQILIQACDSLAEAHASGLTHRDIKPKNIFLCRLGLNYDFIKVLDFGLVKNTAKETFESELTVDGSTTGTPAYMSPEMALGDRQVDHRTDIYSLGCVAYWLLTGHLVFSASGTVPMLLAHVQTPPVPPSQRTEIAIPPDLEQIILDCLRKDPAERPLSAQELSRRLSECTTDTVWDARRAEKWWLSHLPALTLPSAAGSAGAKS